MQIQIEILNVSKAKFPKYEQLDVAYRDLGQNKVAGKKLVSFLYPEVFKALDGAQTGVKFTIEMNKEAGKDGKEYWQWQSISQGVSEASMPTANSSPKGNTSPKSTYETPEERAKRQVYIVRQSSISSAVDFFKDKKTATEADVLKLAQEFVDFVFEKEYNNTLSDKSSNVQADWPSDDIPY